MVNRMKTYTHKKHIWIWILTFVYIGWIFSNSLANGNTSGSLSKDVTQVVMNIVHSAGFSISFDLLHHYVRKLAHFSEYFLLGCFVCESLHLSDLFPKKKITFFVLWIGTPSIDEGIQHFIPGRYGAITDVCIDMSGFICGTLFLYIILCIMQDIHLRRNHYSRKINR